MRKQKNIIQFTPYYPPHIGGVEKVVEEIYGKWTYGKSFIVSGNLCQQLNVYNEKSDSGGKFFFSGIDIIDNFFIPAFWTKTFWIQLGKLRKIILDSPEDFYIITHTRFFVTSLIGGVFAKKNKIKWIHIEHGSNYTKLSSHFKTKIAYIYDRIFGKWILKNANTVLCISQASKKFVEKEFGRKDVEVWYRGIDIPFTESRKNISGIELVFVGRLVNLKGVDILIEAYKSLILEIPLIIIGDGEDKKKLEEKSQGYNISFFGSKSREFILEYLSSNRCIVVNPSYQEGLPTTVIEALLTKNVVIATDVGGTEEISGENDIFFVSPGNIQELRSAILIAKEKYVSLQGRSYLKVKEKFNQEESSKNLYNFLD